MCCCTDAVVAHDLGNDAAGVLQAFSSLANRRTEGENSAESLPREQAPVTPWATSRKVWLSILFLPKSFPQTCRFCLYLPNKQIES